MFFFRRKSPTPLDEVFRHIGAAVEILYTYKRNKHYHPTEDELKQFTNAREAFWQAQSTAGYIERCLHQRFRGEQEGAKKFTDSEVFDYHYPP